MSICAIVSLLLLAPQSHAWQTRIQGDGTTDLVIKNSGYVVVTDDADNVIVGGTLANASNGATHDEFVVAKFSATDGAELWRTSLGIGSVSALARAEPGFVVAVGTYLATPSTPTDMRVAKLSEATGQVVWSKTIAGDDGLGEYASAVAIDADGRVIVGGTLQTGGKSLFLVLKLEKNTGGEIWRHQLDVFGGPDGASAVAVDQHGDVLAAGEATGLGLKIALVKLAHADGHELWIQDQLGFGSQCIARGLALDSLGNPIVVGNTAEISDAQNPDLDGMFARKFDTTNGNEIWNFDVFFHNTGTLYAVAVDSHDDVLVTGNLENRVDDGTFVEHPLVVMKLAGATGVEQWRYRRTDRQSSSGYAIAVDRADNVLVAGFIDVFKKRLIRNGAVLKLSGSNGIPVWQRAIPDSQLFAVATDTHDVVTAAGQDEVDEHGFSSFLLATRIVPSAEGKQIVVGDNVLKPAKRKIQVAVKDTDFVLPSPGSSGDPTVAGATLVVTNPTTHETATFNLPAANWKGVKAYKYSDKKPFEGPCRAGVVKKGQWQITCSGEQIPFTLDEASQGSIAATLTVGSERSCVLFGGEVKKDIPAVGKKAGVFQAKNALPPPACL